MNCFFCFALSSSLIAAGGTVSPNALLITAETHVAIETGPVILEVKLRNNGKSDVHIFYHDIGDILATPRSPWSIKPCEGFRPIDCDGVLIDRILKKNETIVKYLPLHYHFSGIKSGRHNLKIEWRIYDERIREADQFESLPPKFTLTHDHIVIVDEPTNANVSKLYSSVDEKLAGKSISASDMELIEECLVETSLQEGLPRALRLIDLMRTDDDRRGVVSWMFSTCKHELVCSAAIDHLLTSSPVAAVALLEGIRCFSPRQLTAKRAAQLIGAPNLWVRVVTCVTFPQLYGRKERDDLLNEIMANDSLSRADLDACLKSLNSNSFKERQRAMNEVVSLGEKAIPALTQILDSGIDAHLDEQVRRAIKIIELRPAEKSDMDMLSYLSSKSQRSEDAVAIMRALSSGPPHRWRTKEARRYLTELGLK